MPTILERVPQTLSQKHLLPALWSSLSDFPTLLESWTSPDLHCIHSYTEYYVGEDGVEVLVMELDHQVFS